MAINIEKYISLSNLTTFKIGGETKYLIRVRNLEEIREAVNFSKENKLPIFVLGGGSNLLVSDDGFDGVVIKNEILGTEFRDDGEFVLAKAEAGESWDGFVSECVSQGLFGIENLSGIPGTVGASPVQNIGAYGVEVKDTIFSVEVFDIRNGEVKIFENKDCQFSYRDSFFKTKEGKNFIVLSVTFKLKKVGALNLEYKDLKNYFQDKPLVTLEKVRSAVLEIRSKKFPDLKIFGTAGSFFKNPILGNSQFQTLSEKFQNIPAFPVFGEDKVKISLAWILDNVCNLKGFSKGKVALFERQPIVVINKGGATAAEVANFVEEISDLVKQKTGVDIVWEVEKL